MRAAALKTLHHQSTRLAPSTRVEDGTIRNVPENSSTTEQQENLVKGFRATKTLFTFEEDR